MHAIVRRLTQITISVGLLLGIVSTSVQGQNSNTPWSPPRVLGEGWWQSITVDRHDTAYIGWYDAINNNDMLMYASRTQDGTWSPTNDVLLANIPPPSGLTVRNALAVSSDGVLYAVFRAGTRHDFSSAYTTLSGVASNWSVPIEVGSGYYVDMIADQNDVLHVVSSNLATDRETDEPVSLENDPCAYCSDLYYRRSTDGGRTWSLPYNITRTPGAGADRQDIWQGTSGRLYIVWDEGYDWYVGRGTPQSVSMVYSENGGITWSAPIILDGGGQITGRPIQIAATELRDGSLLAVWRSSSYDDRYIYFQLSTDLGETWTEPSPIPGVFARDLDETPLDDYELVTDQRGIAHLFVVGKPDESSLANPTLYHIEYYQNAWRSMQSVFYSSQERPEWPKAAIGPQGDIHLTWFVRGLAEGVTAFTSSTVGLKVYYSYRASNWPEQPLLAFNPTRTPLPTLTPFQRLEPTLTPFPTTEPVGNPTSMTTRDNQAAQTFLGGLFVTGIFCLVVVVVYRNILRR